MKHYAWRVWNNTDPERSARNKIRADRAAAFRLAKETSGIIEGLESSLLIFGEEDQVEREAKYQNYLIGLLGDMFPGCFIQKLDSSYTQGIPDLLILFGPNWAVLEVKAYEGAPEQPNQAWYVGELDAMSFARFIYPENEKEVLRELEQAFRPERRTRVPVRK